MYVLNKTTEYLGLGSGFEVEAVTCANSLEELREIKEILESRVKLEEDNISYEIMAIEPIEDIRKRVGFDFDKTLYDIINLGLDVEEQYLADEGKTRYHLPTDVTLEKDNEIIVTFEKGNRKRIIIEDME